MWGVGKFFCEGATFVLRCLTNVSISGLANVELHYCIKAKQAPHANCIKRLGRKGVVYLCSGVSIPQS